MKCFLFILILFVKPLQQGVNPVDVSLIELIANPNQFHEKKVAVRAFLTVRFEDDALYLNSDDSKYFISNAVWVNFSKTQRNSALKLNNKFVEIIAIFNKDSRGHDGAYKGSLVNIESISELRKWYK